MIQIVTIGLGGFLGAISRFLVSKYAASFLQPFPLGTLIVNIVGSFVLAFINYSILSGKTVPTDIRSFASIGFLGAFTTMSTFSYETMRFLDQGEYSYFVANAGLNLILCFAAIALGRYCALLLSK